GGPAANAGRPSRRRAAGLRPLCAPPPAPLAMIRTAWFYVVVVFSTIIHATAPIVAAILRIRYRPGGVYDWGTNDWSRDLLAAAGTKVRPEGLERIPRDQPVVYASNHSSMFDIWALAVTLPGSVRFVAKEELTRVPLLGPGMLAAGHISIDRGRKKQAFEAYARAAQTIRSGFSAVVFPEGTRSRTGELLPFKSAKSSTAGATRRSRPTSPWRAARPAGRPSRVGRPPGSTRPWSCATGTRSASRARASSRP